MRGALAARTGGASPRGILAELAQQLAGDLAGYFDELPMYRFSGRVARDTPLVGRFLPRSVAHRVLLGRYRTATLPRSGAPGWTTRSATIHLLALGEDGVIRRGTWRGIIVAAEGSIIRTDPLEWDSVLLRNVPTHSLRLQRWTAGPDVHDVADPGRVLECLAGIVQRLTADSTRDLRLLDRLL